MMNQRMKTLLRRILVLVIAAAIVIGYGLHRASDSTLRATAVPVEQTGEEQGEDNGQDEDLPGEPEENDAPGTIEGDPATAESVTNLTIPVKAGGEETHGSVSDAASAEAAEMPAQDFEGAAGKVSVSASVDEGILPAGTTMEVSKVKNADEKDIGEAVQDAIGEAEGSVVSVTAVDVSFLDPDGNVLLPEQEISVVLQADVLADGKDDVRQNIVRIDEEGNAEVIADVKIEGDQAEFTAEAAPVYAIVGTTIEKNVLASDGKNYKVTVTYGTEAGIPEGAELEVEEILPGENVEASASSVYGKSYEEYVAYTESALGMEEGSAGYIRLFDIKIVDKDDHSVKYQPKEGTTVDVHIELADKDSSDEAAENTQMVHFSDGSKTGEVVESISVEGNAISFKAEGFSAYAIVEGPKAITSNQEQIASLDDIKEDQPYIFSISRGGVNYMTAVPASGNNEFAGSTSSTEAEEWYFEAADKEDHYYIYRYNESNKEYIYVKNGKAQIALSETDKTPFIIEINKNTNIRGSFYIYHNSAGDSKPYALSVRGNRQFFLENRPNGNNTNECVMITRINKLPEDPYDLNEKTYGLMNWTGGVAGKALMAASSAANALDAKALTVMSTTDNSSQLFAPSDSDISMWTFHWRNGDKYRISTVADGSTKYLKIDSNGLSLVSDESEASDIQIIPGSGTHAGEICLKSGTNTLTFSGTVADGFSANGTAGSEWLNLVELSELTTDYFLTYSARKVSVSDESITNGSRVIVYTRSWNEEKLKYDFYAISSDGSLVPVYESGDSIEWVSGQINTLLWNFVEYYWEGTTDPNNYYELYNQYSEKFIAPRITGNQILSDDTIGINLNGRRDGQYYSTILAWDEDNYSYVGLKVEDGKIVTCPKSEAMDFYFAVMQDMNVDDTLTTVPTVDHTQYGITMKIVNFGGKTGAHDGGSTSTEEQYAVIGNGSYTQNAQKSGLLSTNLDEDGYPIAVKTNKSLLELFKNAQEVNHLFISSTYKGTGYYEYDSTQNFATLTDSGDFRVYKELGTMDGDNKNTLKHGQFMPFNDLEAGVFASVNGKNLYSAEAKWLSDSDPRKYEQMYLVRNPDYYYGVELEASFTQTPSGLDAWGHDIIYEFTGDDDFWLYVDGELVIDLGGIHGALPGSVNFRTGEVVVNGTKTTLRKLFESNYRGRNPEASNEDVAAFLGQYFDEGSTVFKDDTTHTMRIFYMERGAGAANLHMRFNLAAIKKGTVQLTKELDGVDEDDVLAEFPYQIWYKKKNGTEHRLTNALAHSLQNDDYVLYKDTVNPVKYQKSIKISGNEYKDVFFLKPGETADISFPEGTTSYRIVECGVNTDVYSDVTVNNQLLSGTAVDGSSKRKDYGIEYDTTDNRSRVNYVNKVNPAALRTLTIKKQLYDADGATPISYSENQTEFTFRMYLASEFSELDVANMQTYHVKDPDGNYCQWDSKGKTFVKIGEGKKNFSDLDDTQKDAARFTTSIYGTIGRVPADFTVEFRNVLAGTQYRVEERPDEIPDGYSFQKYDDFDTDNAEIVERGNTGIKGVRGTVVSGKDAPVVVCNLKGWGLRVNKVWRDKDYMSSRDDAYFALFTVKKEGNEETEALTLVPGSVRKLSYESDPQTIYWYYDNLPVAGTTGLGDYLIREVKLEADSERSIKVNDDDTVTGFDSVIPIGDNEQIDLSGTQKGETSPSQFTYQVQYETGEISNYSNVRVDTVTNDRPGLILKKQDWSGQPLKGATFTLETDETAIGTFTSDEDGLITTAFLSNGKEYVLTETTSPQGYHGLETMMKIRVNNGVVSVSGPDEAYYKLTQAQETTLATLVIKNCPFTFRAVKKDGDTNAPIAGVEFALHRQVTVDGVITIDLNPMPGYESLKTDENGVVPKIDNTLPAGTYELREKKPLNDYEMLSGYIRFTISPTGEITLGTNPGSVELTGEQNHEGVLEYVLTIPNYKRREVTFTKAWRESVGNAKISWPDDTSITVNILRAKGESDRDPVLYATYSITQSDVGTLNTEIEATNDGTLPKLRVTGNSDGAYTFQLADLPATGSENGNTVNYVYYVSEPEAVDGFQNAKYFNGGEQAMGAKWIGDGGTICNDQIGYTLPSTGGRGTNLICLLGILLITMAGAGLAMRRQKRRS